MLPDAKYIRCQCARCGRDYKMDLGGDYRHEYVTFIKRETTTCPLCNCKMNIPRNSMVYGTCLN